MLDTDDIPTPLLRPGERPEVAIEPVRSHRLRSLTVARRLLSLFARLGAGGLSPREAGRVAFESVRSLGGLWAKLATTLSWAHATLPPGTMFELMRLHHVAPGFDPLLARRGIERELERPVDWLFREFEDRPFAAGTIAQVHRGVLREGGERVVVKVQRPDAEDLFRRDLSLLGLAIGVLRRLGRYRHLRLGEMHRELSKAAGEELDYRREAANLKRLRKNLAGHGIHVPRVFERVSGRRVLVMEEVEGVFLSDLLDVMDSDPDRARTWLDENGIDPERVARRLYRSMLRQAFEEGLFHGEPGPGNVVLLRNGKVALVDAGSVGRLYPDFQRTYSRFLRSVLGREYKDAVDRFIRFFEPVPPVDLDQLKKDLLRVFRSWDTATRIRELPYAVRSSASVMARIGQVCASYRIPLEWYYARLDRAFLGVDACMRFLYPRVDFHVELARYFRASRRRAFLAAPLRPGPLSGLDLHDLDVQIEDLGNDFADIVRRSSLDFETTGNKLAAVAGLVLSRVKIVAVVAGLFLLVVFFDQSIRPIRPSGNWTRLGDAVAWFPRLSAADWALSGGLFALAYRMISRVTLRLSRKESQYRPLIP